MRIIVGTNLSHHCRSIGAFDCYMGYILGLQQLGHEVYVFDEVDAKRCYDDNHRQVRFDEWEGRNRFASLAKTYGIWSRCCMIYNFGESTYGMDYSKVLELAKTAEVLFNISGRVTNPDILDRVRCKAYIDEAPGKTQVYFSEYDVDRGLKQHEYFFTVGLNIGTEHCEIPDCGVAWHGIVHPVDLSMWPSQIDSSCRRFTTISNWEGKHTFDYRGRFSGDKAQNWRQFISLPSRTDQEMEIALNIDKAYSEDLRHFADNGSILTDPKRMHSFEDLNSYIGSSRAEFSVTNQRCVEFNIGWTGDRTARYLASGTPAVIQGNGIQGHVPLGEGFVSFRSLEEALSAIDEVNTAYLAHCRAARQIAEEYFDARAVASIMLKHVGY